MQQTDLCSFGGSLDMDPKPLPEFDLICFVSPSSSVNVCRMLILIMYKLLVLEKYLNS